MFRVRPIPVAGIPPRIGPATVNSHRPNKKKKWKASAMGEVHFSSQTPLQSIVALNAYMAEFMGEVPLTEKPPLPKRLAKLITTEFLF